MAATAEALLHPTRSELTLESVLNALSDPVRLQIIRTLAVEKERACGTFGLPVTKSTASHHFRVLREAGLIRQREEGRTKMTCLRREDVDARFPGLLQSVLSASS